MKSAEAFLTKNGLPKWTKVERIAQGTETTIFKQYFKSWKEPEDSLYSGLRRVYPMESIGTFSKQSRGGVQGGAEGRGLEPPHFLRFTK